MTRIRALVSLHDDAMHNLQFLRLIWAEGDTSHRRVIVANSRYSIYSNLSMMSISKHSKLSKY